MRDFLKQRFLMPCAGNLTNDSGEEFFPAFKKWNEKGKASSTQQNLQQYYFSSSVASFARVPWYGNTNVTVTALLSAYCAMYSEDNASPGLVEYFMCHKLTIDGVEREHYFAFCVGLRNTLRPHVWELLAPSLSGMETTFNQDHVILF